MLIDIQGYCPACGEAKLQVSSQQGGVVYCNEPNCPKPDAAHKILQDQEREHVLRLDDDGWTLKHPLRERLNSDLFDCPTTTALADLIERTDIENTAKGKYRVVDNQGVLTLTGIP
jgi:Family of unknown function (DUF6085)